VISSNTNAGYKSTTTK